MELRLVADTNIFLECRPLEELPWHELGRDPIVLLLSKPVLDEIDRHKNATGRTRNRALAVYGRVRGMLHDGVRDTEIRSSLPRVILRLLEATAPDARRADLLDYGRADDRLVGIVSALQDDERDTTTELFTDDTGPASTAADLRLPFRMIRDGWRRPPGEGTEAKRIRDLERDLATYRAQEPSIAIAVDGREPGALHVKKLVATALTAGEIDAIVARLCAKHPVDTVPDIPEPIVESHATGEAVRTVFLPPAEDEVARYRDVDHPAWIGRCRQILATLHEGRGENEPPITLRWSIRNGGTRPASRARVEFEAKGRLKLVRVARVDEGAAKDMPPPQSLPTAGFPPPPRPPALRTQVTRTQPPREPPVKSAVPALMRDAPQTYRGMIEAASMLGGADAFKIGLPTAFQVSDFEAFSRAVKSFRSVDDLAPYLSAARAGPTDAASLRGMLEAERAIGRAAAIYEPRVDPIPPFALRSTPRDPEAFYWDWRVGESVTRGALTCDLWRHRTGAQVIEFEVVFEGESPVNGAVECTVHAENLTRPASETVNVSRSIENVDMRAVADRMVERCE